ncbi:MAG TPA: amino acid adenylation domain-containing protein [Pyrinomonadaceae bacterium]|nr:amino acid adenylation domain-containing protein [Pyrinomonadaceae bacterium]
MSNQVIEGFRLSPQQEHVWRLEQAAHPSPYRAQCAVRIEGQLNAGELRAAIEDVVRRHEILRTTFTRPVSMMTSLQTVGEVAGFSFQRGDLSGLEDEEKTRAVERLYEEFGLEPFDLEAGPLLRVSLQCLGGNDHVLLLALPALCADRVALDNFVREIGRTYAARGAKHEDEVTQYIVFAEWQNELLASEDAEVGREFWRTQQLSELPPLTLPVERRAENKTEFAPRIVRTLLPRETFAEVAILAERQATTASAVLLACWQTLLGRLSGEREFVVGLGCDGRSDEELAGALGPFAKYLPLRLSADEGASFVQLLSEADSAARAASEWHECFTWELIAPRATAGEDRYFPFCFEFYEAPEPLDAGEVKFDVTRSYACTDRFHLLLSCVVENENMWTEFHYDAGAFDAGEVERIAGQYHALLRSAVENIEAPAGGLEILTNEELHRVVYEFNQTSVDFPQEKLLHKLFEEQAARTPEHAALESEGEKLTYAELDRRSNQLARRLRLAGVGPEVAVGVLLDRSPEMVVALLGVLKAGGFYVPIDPAYPSERISVILRDSRPALLLTQTHLEASLSAHRLPLICLDREVGDDTDNGVEAGATPDNLAYIIYTSGSTGVPKGVMISHRAISNRLLWMQRAYPLGAGDRVLQKTSISFDASIWEFFVPLISGATLVMARPGGHQDSAYLADAVASHGVTTLQLVPSMLQVMLDEPGFAKCSSLKRLFCGGEALTGEMQARFFELHDAELINLYGPTEVSIDATSWQCQSHSEHRVVPIGRPLANVRVYLLNAYQRPVPLGLPGEIYVGGVGLARGYHNLSSLTAEKFVPDPFSTERGARLYRTGDLGRQLPDGTLEFLGRADHQVKLRGFRIELGEIEAALERHPAVNRAVVVVYEDETAGPRLAAYVLANEGEDLTGGDLRSFLEETLPEYMVPVTFVPLEELPLLPNGKVDRRSLPALDTASMTANGNFVAPRNAIEELLAGMWAEILNVRQVGIHDNFFDLGGHSLLAVRLNSRLRSTFRVEASLNLLFETPTVAGLAETIGRLARAGGGAEEQPIVPVPRDGKLPLSFAQRRLWFFQQLEPDNPVYNIPIAVLLSGALDTVALERALNEIVRRHEVLRTTFTTVDGEPVQIIHTNARLELPVTNLSGMPESERHNEVERRAREEAHRPFDLARSLPVRARLLRLDDEEHALLVTLHHIAADGWSLSLFVREFAALYDAFHAGRPSPLEELNVQYADYAVWQRNWLAGDVLERQLAYWRQQLAGCEPVLQLPTDRPRPAMQTYRGGKESFAVPAALYDELRALSRKEDATLFMTMAAAFLVVLHRHTGQEDINLGSNIAGRNRLETEGLIGFFINLLVIRGCLSGDPTFSELLSRVRESAMGAYAHQDVSFEKLVEELQPPRDPSRAPLVQVILDFVNQQTSIPQLPGLELRTLPLGEHLGKFDLTLNVEVGEHGLGVALQYNADLFDTSTVARLLNHFEIVLREAAADPHVRLGTLAELLSRADREQLLSERAGLKEKRRQMLKVARQR